ncbi:MAG: DNA translocase FtsK, partial [Spirochaetaceae bacterium]|nr:DNA translocase FtsK [Spirochaetaceae bacterium]
MFDIGKILFDTYKFSSFLIPLFCFIAGICCFSTTWDDRKGFVLFFSFVPFFTIVKIEQLCYDLLSIEKGPILSIKMSALITISIMVLSIEYIIANIIGIKIENRNKGEKEVSPAYDLDFNEVKDDWYSTDLEEVTEQVIPETEENEILHSEDEQAFLSDPFGEAEALSENSNEKTIADMQAEYDAFSDDTEELEIEVENEYEAEDEYNDEYNDVYQDAYPNPFEEYNENEGSQDYIPEDDYPEIIENTKKIDEFDFEEEDSQDEDSDIEFPLFYEEETEQDEYELEKSENNEPEEIYEIEENQEIEEPEEIQEKNEEDELDVADVFAADTSFDFPFFETKKTEPQEQSLLNSMTVIADQQKTETTSASAQQASQENASPLIERAVPARKKNAPYSVPTNELLTTYPDGEYWVIDDDTLAAAGELKDTLSEFKIEAEVTGIRKGPVITMFEILPAPGVKLSKIVALQDNIALRLAASSVRIVAPIPGKHAVGIEVPNKERAIVSFKELIETDAPGFRKHAIPVVLGKDITGEAQIIDLAKTPHLLIAGSTGSGKSVCVNTMILSILYKRSPQDVKMILIDPKIVELKLYNDIPHLLVPVITEPKKAFQALQYCLCEMERRYALLDGMGVRDITNYNHRIKERNIATEKLPYIVVIIDEFADLMATTGKELESTVARLAAMSRAVGIHLVLATQRPSIDVITGLIKANIPTRIAFMVASKMDSRIIIDQIGAEKLLGKGDMLYASATDPFPVRIQGTFVSDSEVENVVEFVKQYGEPEYIDDEMFVDDEEVDMEPGLFSDGDDPLYEQALEIVLQAGKASASYIQRRLKIGYNRAARLVEEMEARGIVGPANGSKPRDILHM